MDTPKGPCLGRIVGLLLLAVTAILVRPHRYLRPQTTPTVFKGVPEGKSFKAALVTVVSETHVNDSGGNLRSNLPTWSEFLPWAHGKYPLIAFYAKGRIPDATLRELQAVQRGLEVRFVPFEYGEEQTEDNARSTPTRYPQCP